MELDAITQLISNLGFPIAVCLWFMLRTEKVIKSNTDALHALLNKIK